MSVQKSLAYGYLRVPHDADDEVVRGLETRIRCYAEHRGFEFVTIFHEFDSGYFSAWAELAEELRRSQSYCVIVPAIDHVSRHPLLCRLMLARLAADANAEVFEPGD